MPSPIRSLATPFHATEGPLATSSLRYSSLGSIKKMLQARQSSVILKMLTIDSRTEEVERLLVI
jgi:hypothetical protein